jgi:hypothetical protein
MLTRGTTHLTMSEFELALALAKPGEQIVYATGDLGVSAVYSTELTRLRGHTQALNESRAGFLTMRRLADVVFVRGGASFEYIFTKAGRSEQPTACQQQPHD